MISRYIGKLCLPLLFVCISINAQAERLETCIESELAQISKIYLEDTKSTILELHGEPSSISLVPDKDSSGQNSGELFHYEGLELFVADIGGVAYIKTTNPKHESVFGIAVGMTSTMVASLLGVDLKNAKKVSVYLCDQPSFTDPEIVFNFETVDKARLVSIEISQGEL